MASVKKSTLPLKSSVNSKITTTTTKPISKEPLASKISNPAIVKKPTVVVKTTSEKITAAKSTTLLKSTSIKPTASSSPTKTTKLPTTSSSVKVTSTVKSVADSTSMLKAKVAVKTSSNVAKKPIQKVIAPTPVVKKPLISIPKSVSSTNEKSTKLATTARVSTVKSSTPSSTPIKARSSSITNTQSPSTAKTSKPITNKNLQSTIARTLTKLTSQVPSKTTSKNIGAKTPLKLSTVVKSANALAAVKSASTRDVIKRLQDVSEIEIRDADSTTREECVSKDSSHKSDENGNFKQESRVDEERVYAVAEQLICVMQPEELEVITGDAEQIDKDSYVIDMSAVEEEETNTELLDKLINNDPASASETPLLQELSKCEENHIEKLNNQSPTEVESRPTTDEETMIFEMRELKIQGTEEICHNLNDNLEQKTDNTPIEECIGTGQMIDNDDSEFPPSNAGKDEKMIVMPNDQNELFQNRSSSFDARSFAKIRSAENLLESEISLQNFCSGLPILDDPKIESFNKVEPTTKNIEKSDEMSTLNTNVELETNKEASENEKMIQDNLSVADISYNKGFIANNNAGEELLLRPTEFDSDELMSNRQESGNTKVENLNKAEPDDASERVRVSHINIENVVEISPEFVLEMNAESFIEATQGEQMKNGESLQSVGLITDISSDDGCTKHINDAEDILSLEVDTQTSGVCKISSNPETLRLLEMSENSSNSELELMNFDTIPNNVDRKENFIRLNIPLNINNADLTNDSVIEPIVDIFSNEQSCSGDGLKLEQNKNENFMAFGNFEDIIGMSYAEVLLSSKTSSSDDDSLEIVENINTVYRLPTLMQMEDADDGIHPQQLAIHMDKTSEECHVSTTIIDAAVDSTIPIYSLYDNTEFPDVVPSDEHYEKQDHEVDSHDETFHRIRHKRNKRRNKKNRKSINSSENLDEESQSPKNIHSEKPNHQAQYHGRRRNSRRWRNSRAYFEAFHQPQQSHQQEYYRDSHWKYTDAKLD